MQMVDANAKQTLSFFSTQLRLRFLKFKQRSCEVESPRRETPSDGVSFKRVLAGS
jgi:hypothetical protein